MSSGNVAVVGLQWGDEGKGKIVDALSRTCRYVAVLRGRNAGHTVLIGREKFILHLVPCGVLRRGTVNVIGNGVVFDPAQAIEEMAALRARGVEVGPANLRISAGAHVVMPWHKQADILSEQALPPGKRIGTTARGIGPCYADKAIRSTAIRVGELPDGELLAPKIRDIAAAKNRVFAALYDADPMDAEAIAAQYVAYGKELAAMIDDTGAILRNAVAAGKRILFEGGQGSMLDVDHGTYPFVTSSSVTACGIPSGAGICPADVGQVVGLIKAYTTRVGEGPFPTEQDNPTGQYLRNKGNEYGATTGRPRRCGWFDAVAVRYAAEVSGADELAIGLLDVLTGIEEIKICTGYRLDGKDVSSFDASALAGAECVYQTLAGWQDDISGCRTFDDLPDAARGYVTAIEDLVGRKIGFISVGAERTQTIVHNTRIKGLD